jgi:aerobic-type carbon monoxide dehydrogenase small subunit (CoxS/CutS family)
VTAANDSSTDPKVDLTVTVNGEVISTEVPARVHAADFLRHHLGLTGTHVGCEQGVCGMCTVIIGGEAVKSCLMFVGQLDGQIVETVESLAVDDRLNPLQRCFKEEHALQCGFCTPGFLMTATALARRRERLSATEVREEIAGVLCRCTGYDGIVRAVTRHLDHCADADCADADDSSAAGSRRGAGR